MAKAKKAVKKAVKKVVGVEKKSTSSGWATGAPPAIPSSARKHIESLSKQRRDAAVLWGMIKDGNHSDVEIKEICQDKGFDTLLGEL